MAVQGPRRKIALVARQKVGTRNGSSRTTPSGSARSGAGSNATTSTASGGLPDLAPLCHRLRTRPRGRARTLPYSFQQSEGQVQLAEPSRGQLSRFRSGFPGGCWSVRCFSTSSIWSRNVFFTAFRTAWEIKPQHSPVLLQSGNPALLEEAAGTRSRAQPPPFSFFLAPQHLAPHPPSPGKEPAKEIKNETKRKGINRLPVPWQYKHQWQRPHVQYSNLINK